MQDYLSFILARHCDKNWPFQKGIDDKISYKSSPKILHYYFNFGMVLCSQATKRVLGYSDNQNPVHTQRSVSIDQFFTTWAYKNTMSLLHYYYFAYRHVCILCFSFLVNNIKRAFPFKICFKIITTMPPLRATTAAQLLLFSSDHDRPLISFVLCSPASVTRC